MKTLYKILLLLTAHAVFAQQKTQEFKSYYEQHPVEKVYAQLNNVLYSPGEIVYYKLYIAGADNSPSLQSDFVYADLFDAAGKKIETQRYMTESGSAAGSYTLGSDMPSGLYKLSIYTKYQQHLDLPVFEKSFFVQKVIAPRVLMTLDFKNKGYGPGDTCEADFTIKNLDNKPIRRQVLDFDVFIAGKTVGSYTGTTDADGKAVLRFKLPDDLQTTDGIINVKTTYEGNRESVTRSIPINLHFADLQFLPESGTYINGEPGQLYFIAKNEFGKPLDVQGYIADQNGNKITDFSSYYDGMGKVGFTPQSGKTYTAYITSPFQSKHKYLLPAAVSQGYQLTIKTAATLKQAEGVIYSPVNEACKLLIRNQDKIYKSINIDAKTGSNTIMFDTRGLPMGSYAISVVVNEKIVAERLAFFNYSDGLKIDIKTDRTEYKPREKVTATLTTTDKDGKPVASNLSVSVVDEKILTYIDDKQHNLLTWMLMGSELKGNVHEPRFYFDNKQPYEKRITAIDLLLNTHGWRSYSQREINGYKSDGTMAMPEKTSDIEGFVFDYNNKPASLKVYFMSDSGKVFETRSNSKGYFKFYRTHFEKNALLVTESRNRKQYKITSSIKNFSRVLAMKDSLKVTGTEYRETKQVIKPNTAISTAPQEIAAKPVTMDGDSNQLDEVVVVGYGTYGRSDVTGSVTTVSSRTLEGRPNANFVQTLQGQVAGLNVITGSGQPGANGSVVIRGSSSIYGSRGVYQPLYVIDGVPYSNNENGSILGAISPDMIESITVLKDTDATSVFGGQASAGVIIVKTYRGVGGSGIPLGKTRHYTFENLNRANGLKLNAPSAFYMPVYKSTETAEKTDFRNCIYWNATIQTNAQGTAQFEFYNSDETSSFSIVAEGTSYKGDLGSSKYSYTVKEPVQTDVKIPLYTSQEDIINIPLTVKNNTTSQLSIEADIAASDLFETVKGYQALSLKAGESAIVYYTIKAVKPGKNIPVVFTLNANGYKSTIKKKIDIYGKGFPMSVSVSGTTASNESIGLENAIPGSIASELKFVINPYTAVADGLESMLREPHGCFEQVSSTNYPNIMALQLLSNRGMNEEMKNKAIGYLKSGYQKLKNYESRDGGFEWYGGNPGHEALTAYGLLQFYEMKDFIKVDENLVKRSINWLYSRKDGNNGFKLNSGRYGFSGVKEEVNNAYIVYVLSEIGEKNIWAEYRKALSEARNSKDAYRTALMALAAYNLNDYSTYKELLTAIKSLVDKQGYKYIKTDATIIRSYGQSSMVEWVSLYALAIMKEQKLTPELSSAIDVIQTSKNTNGFGSTQATALALKAITTYARIVKVAVNPADIKANLNGTSLPMVFDGNGNISINTASNILTDANNSIDINISNEQRVPYMFYINYQSYKPDNSPDCQLELKTSLTNKKINVGETTRLEVSVTNKTKTMVNNPLVRIGIPGGATPEPWQLKELVEKNIVDYYEIFGSELVLYFREMNALETRKINIDLKAQVSGVYKGVASSAYLYYNNTHKNWNEGLSVEIQ